MLFGVSVNRFVHWIYSMGLAEKVIQCILSKLYCREVIQEWFSMYLFNVFVQCICSISCREVIQEWLSYGFILWVYPISCREVIQEWLSCIVQCICSMYLSNVFVQCICPISCREVIREWLSYGFILWVYPISCREVIQEWLSYGFVVLHHYVPVTLTPAAIPLIRTFNPDLYTGLLPMVLTTVVT
jgi:hypothetical protein